MGSYTETPTIPSIGGTTTNNKSANPTTSIMGSAGQIAVANNEALTNLLLYMVMQLELKGMEIDNIANAAKAQSDAQIQAGKEQFIGALISGVATIGSGAVNAYGGYKLQQQTKIQEENYEKLKVEAPKTLENLANTLPLKDSSEADGKDPIDKATFKRLLADPTKVDQAELQDKYITDKQKTKLTETAGDFRAETTQAQIDLKKQIGNTSNDYQMFVRAGSEALTGGGTAVKGAFDAQAAKAQAEGTMAQASQSMASGAQDVISSTLSQIAQIIDLLLQAQTQVASATTVR